MRVVLNNKADLPNKYIRKTLWKMYQLRDKFKKLQKAEIYFQKENPKRDELTLVVQIGIPGKAATIKQKSNRNAIEKSINAAFWKAHRFLNKTK